MHTFGRQGPLFPLLPRTERAREVNRRPRLPEPVYLSDRIESDCLEFNSGTEAIVAIAEKRGKLIV